MRAARNRQQPSLQIKVKARTRRSMSLTSVEAAQSFPPHHQSLLALHARQFQAICYQRQCLKWQSLHLPKSYLRFCNPNLLEAYQHMFQLPQLQARSHHSKYTSFLLQTLIFDFWKKPEYAINNDLHRSSLSFGGSCVSGINQASHHRMLLRMSPHRHTTPMAPYVHHSIWLLAQLLSSRRTLLTTFSHPTLVRIFKLG